MWVSRVFQAVAKDLEMCFTRCVTAMDQKIQKPPVMHSFTEPRKKSSSRKVFMIFVLLVVLGIGSGFLFAKYTKATGNQIIPSIGPSMKGKTFGTNDTQTFKDTAEGKLASGGVNGEGQYHLVRPGGDSQNVYLTSSFVDLSQFVGKKIKVWGETQKAQTAGWLMDVGRVEVLE
ncbi:MAG TPA: hypothetical protein VE090_05075 [Methylomirabilota bacterium]|nr:hypothetical protein [Methylomirabilota bacterium]